MRTGMETIEKTVRSVVLIGLFALAGDLSAPASATALDPVVEDVLEMLEAGVEEGVIVQWLESTGRRAADIDRDGMIALTGAGASDRLIGALLEGVEKGSAGRKSAESGGARQEPPPDSAAPTPKTKQTTIADAGAKIEISAGLRAKRVWIDEESPDMPREEPWGIYLYMDGDLLAWTVPSLQGEPVVARRVVEAGRRELRVVLQRYDELRGGWQYESLSVPTLFAFEARPGDPIEVEVEMVRIWGLWRHREDGGPLRYVVRQGETVLAESAGTGGDPDRWQPICEDVEANFPGAETVPRRFRGAMKECVRWGDLWLGLGAATSRSEILAMLAEHEFEPPVH